MLPCNRGDTSQRGTDSQPGFESSFISEFIKSEKLIEFERLPDSTAYLARLESKLGKLQRTSESNIRIPSNRREEGGLVVELRLAREAALTRLVTAETSVLGRTDQEVEEDQEVRSGYLVRRLVPEQAVTLGEKVVLTKADHLEREVEEGELKEQKEPSDLH